ncbi:helix-turn-helix domain-containing protein [Oscillospiraceae bacterium 42-9]
MKRIASNLWAATKRHSVFYICFVSYLFVLLFSLLFNVYNYTAYIAELRAQKDLYDQVMFQQFDEMINSELNKVDSLLLNVLTDTDILRSVSSDDLVSSHQLSKTLRTSILMRNYANDVAGMYIYFDNNDAIVMEGSYYQAQDFYRRFVDQEKMSYEDWHHRQTQLFYRQYEPSYSGDPNEFVLYHTVYGVYGRKALVAITFSLEDIFRIFQNSFFSGQMAFQLTGADQEVLVSFGGENFEEAHNRHITPYTSSRTGWTYLSAIPAQVYDSVINELVFRTVLVLLAELAVGILLSFVFARFNVAPVRALYARVTGQGYARQGSGGGNEYNLVNSHFESLLAEKDQLLKRHNQVVRNNMLLAVLNSSLAWDEVEDGYLDSLGLDLSGPEYQVISILIEYGSASRTNGLERQSLMKYYLMDLVGKGIAAADRPSFADVNWNQVAVILNGGSLQGLTNTLCQELARIKLGFESEFDAFLSIGVSGVHSSFEEIGAAFGESMSALEYRILEDRGAVCAYQDTGARASLKAFYPVIDKVKIKARIRAGDGPGAVALLDSVFEGISSNRTEIPLEVAKCLFFDIMGMGLEVLSEIKFEHGGSYGEYLDMLFACQSIGQLQRTLNHILLEICNSIKKGQSNRNQQLLERIDGYIQENCFNNNFSLVGLADYLGLTPTYLSSFFKEKMGECLMDRVTRLRMAKGKELLSSTKKNVAEIAGQVGYASSGTFIRGFKKLEGITPTQYRQEQAKENTD